MKTIGGEAEVEDKKLFLYITDSGRSSLRLILRSGFQNRKFLLPDFLCDVVLKIFNELNIKYSFYKVKRDLSIDTESIKDKNFDALYLINYFGQRHKVIERLVNIDFLVIEDNVFLPIFDKPKNIKEWIGFNSFRKISYLADGSIVKSTMRLSDKLIIRKESEFSRLKYEAKRIKYEYLHKNRYSQKQYLALFNKAEGLLDQQKKIYSISNHSLFNLFEFHKDLKHEYLIRKKNYSVLNKYLRVKNINIKTQYHSFYILLAEQRDKLKKHLFAKNIFLPIHWTKANSLKNDLYDKIISIPVDSRYRKDDMIKIARLINEFYKLDKE